MMNTMNTWLAEKRETYSSSRSSSVGNFFSSSAGGGTKEKVGSTAGRKASKKTSASTSNGTKRKGRRPNGAKSKREQEEARLARVQLAETDDSDYADSDKDDLSYDEEVIEDSDADDSSDDGGGVDDDDVESVYTTITVETTRTKENENRKPLGPFSGYFGKGPPKEQTTQIIVNPEDAVVSLQEAMNDITKLSICMKDVHVDQDVAASFLKLMRGDGRSWEAIAVDILRQKARWESIVIEECSAKNDATNIQSDDNEEYLNLLLAHILAVDNCAYLHLSNFVWNAQTAWTMQALMFSKSLQKLQLDLIDLTFAIPMLRRGLEQNASLTCLIASRCGLDDDALGDLLGHLPAQVEELRIFGNKCRGKGLAAITKQVARKDTCLKLLDLSYQHVGPNEEFDIQWLADAIRRNSVLKTLDLDNDSIDDGHLTHIVAALTKNTTLEELMLNHNLITGTGVAMLASKFGNMKGLKKISMYSNVFDAATTTTASSSKNASPSTASSGK